MNQIDFMMLSNNVEGAEVKQGSTGITTVTILDDVIVSHNYKKNNKMTVEFGDDKYLIESRTELEQFYATYLENYGESHNTAVKLLKNYCYEKLIKIA